MLYCSASLTVHPSGMEVKNCSAVGSGTETGQVKFLSSTAGGADGSLQDGNKKRDTAKSTAKTRDVNRLVYCMVESPFKEYKMFFKIERALLASLV